MPCREWHHSRCYATARRDTTVVPRRARAPYHRYVTSHNRQTNTTIMPGAQTACLPSIISYNVETDIAMKEASMEEADML